MPSIYELVKTEFNIPVLAQEELSEYFVLKQTKNTIESQIKNGPLGTIVKDKIPYIPIFLTPQNPKIPCYFVSFRRVIGYPYGYALIKDFKEKKGVKK